jgi:hypothetical protein
MVITIHERHEEKETQSKCEEERKEDEGRRNVGEYKTTKK